MNNFLPPQKKKKEREKRFLDFESFVVVSPFTIHSLAHFSIVIYSLHNFCHNIFIICFSTCLKKKYHALMYKNLTTKLKKIDEMKSII